MHNLETKNTGDLIGLLEILEDEDRSVDIAELDDILDEERTTLLNLLVDAEALGLIDVSSGDVKLTDLGRKFLKSDINERRDILREQLQQIEPFNSLMDLYRKSGERRISREDLYEFISNVFPSDDNDKTFGLIINWGRYSRLIEYDSDSEEMILLG
ncbi:MAG: AAA-associated domain-containing protein [Candidatus Thermoplasmatota archaeon]|nr:AAA-associated domain-containing protein [Candidatus Thermoplasmatota archaeon]MCL5668136.1 AAA-associated domain-containing protein [Candidatus Thermoplasmatota archaeon]